MFDLTGDERERYSRQILLPEIGSSGQQRLKSARVLIVGAGGLGSPVLFYLAAAGVGQITVLDFDLLDRSNLQRQILFQDSELGKSKASLAAARASALNPDISVKALNKRLDADNAMQLVSDHDLVVDASDNFETRYLLNDACILAAKPNVYGALYRFEGQLSVFGFEGGPCYRCLFPQAPAADSVLNCAEAGVLGVIAGVVGCLQATEALKIILQLPEVLSGKLLVYDALSLDFDKLAIKKNPDCKLCGNNAEIKELRAEKVYVCQSETKEERGLSKQITAVELSELLKNGAEFKLLDVRNPDEFALGRIEGACLIPLSELQDRLGELDKDEHYVVYCKSGARSLKAISILNAYGFDKTKNLLGGILAWAQDVDRSVMLG